MNKLKSIAFYCGISLIVLISIIFAFVEIRPLFAGDFKLMNNPSMSFMTYLFRGQFYLGLVALASILLGFRSSKTKVNLIVFAFALGMFVGSCFCFFFYDFYIALVPVTLATILSVLAGHSFFKKEGE